MYFVFSGRQDIRAQVLGLSIQEKNHFQIRKLTANKWQVVMERPIASGADPFDAAAA